MSEHTLATPTALPLLGLLAALSIGAPSRAQGTGPAWSPVLEEPTVLALAAGRPSESQETPPATATVGNERYLNFIELAVSSESVMGGYRRYTEREDGYFSVNYLGNEDDDFAASVQVVRIGQVVGYPFRLGAGLGSYVVLVDKPDANVYAISLSGLAEYDLDSIYPTTLSAEASFAPDITTFDDGEGLFEFQIRADLDISYSATAFVGYHALEVDDGRTRKLDNRLHVGVRLGF